MSDGPFFPEAGLPRLFANRGEAGARLARALLEYRGARPLVLGIPRGGVPVAAEVARALDGDLDVIVARKLGSPVSPELAVGAVTSDGARYLNQEAIDMLEVSPEYLESVTREQVAEAQAREQRFRAGRPPLAVEGRVVIVVDDGLATGSTMIAAVRSVRARKPAKLGIAVPVAPRETVAAMRAESDDVVCPETPEPFIAVGIHYQDFSQTEDEEVQRIMGEWHAPAAAPAK